MAVILVLGLAVAALVAVILLGIGLAGAARQQARLAQGMDGTPLAMKVPRQQRAPDPPRARALLIDINILLAGADGAFSYARGIRRDGTDQDEAQDDDVLDAVTNLREAYGMLREAAEIDPVVEAALARHDPWTEPAWLDAIHMDASKAGDALGEGVEWTRAVIRSIRQIPELG